MCCVAIGARATGVANAPLVIADSASAKGRAFIMFSFPMEYPVEYSR